MFITMTKKKHYAFSFCRHDMCKYWNLRKEMCVKYMTLNQLLTLYVVDNLALYCFCRAILSEKVK